MSGKLIVVVGLPGSGKTTIMKSLKQAGRVNEIFDDYQAGTTGDVKDPRSSRYYSSLLAALRAGKAAAVSDVRYCVHAELHRFLAAVLAEIPEVELELYYFENDPEQCRKNIIKRERHIETVERELKLVKEYAPHYAVSKITTCKVYRP